MNIKKIAAALLALTLCIGLSACGKQKNGNTEASSETEKYGTHHAVITVENYGEIKVELDGDTAPITVKNFVELAKSGFYDGLTFHRIISGFMIQGGDPKGNGTGGSDNTIKGEFSVNGVQNNISHKRGVISMARNQFDYNSASSQFFICLRNSCSADLDGQYAAFGKVTEGMDIIDKICESVPESDCIPTEQQPVIKTIKVID